jgi:hypothetical protein
MRGKRTAFVKLNLIRVIHGQSYTSSTSKVENLELFLLIMSIGYCRHSNWPLIG